MSNTAGPSLMYTLLHWVVSALALMLTAYLVPGFKVSGFFDALIVAVVIGIANVVIWPLLILLTLPLNILTLGLFTFVVNAIVLKICAALVPGFNIATWTAAIIGAIILAFAGSFLHFILV